MPHTNRFAESLELLTADLEPGWAQVVRPFLASPEGAALQLRLDRALRQQRTVFPSDPLRALRLTPRAGVRVVILGQDPYHTSGQAEGLAFSVPEGVRPPPSLRNIFRERERDLELPPPASPSLVPWARRGVLLLNTCLTVEEANPGAHAGWGWEALTSEIVAAVAADPGPRVFMLWGAHAKALRAVIDAAPGARLVLEAQHPSPLSALRPPTPFIGCGHFGLAAAYLKDPGLWDL